MNDMTNNGMANGFAEAIPTPTNNQQPPAPPVNESGASAESKVADHELSFIPGVQARETASYTSAEGRNLMRATAIDDYAATLGSIPEDDGKPDVGFATVDDNGILSISAMVKGTNIVNPMAINLHKFDIKDKKLTGTQFESNSTSIFGIGSMKLAALENSMTTMKTQITNYYNRSTPFTDFEPQDRLFMIAAYERDLLYAQLFYKALGDIRAYAKWLQARGINMDSTWDCFYDPELYTNLAAGAKLLATLPVFDFHSHEKLQQLSGFKAAAQAVEYPGSVIAQNIAIMDFTKANGGNGELVITHDKYSVNCQSVFTTVTESWAEMISKFVNNPTMIASYIATFNDAVSELRRRYEIIITAFTQLFNKKAMEARHMSQYMCLDVDETTGYAIPNYDEIAYSHYFKNRFTFAPWSVAAEDEDGSNVVTSWQLHAMPGDSIRGTSGTLYRPYGLFKTEKVWTTEEMAYIGLWRAFSSLSRTFSGASPFLDTNNGTIWCDPIDGWYYADAVIPQQGHALVIHGLSCYSGGNNLLSAPNFTQIAPTPNIIGFTMATATNSNGGRLGCALSAKSNSGPNIEDDAEVMEQRMAFWAALAEQFDLVYLPLCGSGSDTGHRDIAPVIYRPYRDSSWTTLSANTINSALAGTINQLVPVAVYKSRSDK